jgi:hypothetical protein
MFALSQVHPHVMVPTVNLLTSILLLHNGRAVTGYTRSLTLLPRSVTVLGIVQECSAGDMTCGGNNTLKLVFRNLLFNSTLSYLLYHEERRVAQTIFPVGSFVNNNEEENYFSKSWISFLILFY